MKFPITFTFVIVQILLLTCCNEIFEEFEELTVARECFPPQLLDPNYPLCEFFVPRNVIDGLMWNCINQTKVSDSALRIVGEFRILKIICTASFPIDFQYYGVVPTEAIIIDWYKKVEPNSEESLQKFTVEVKVYSVEELFKFYNNSGNSYYKNIEDFLPLTTVHDYSRSGSYEFHGIFNKTLGTSFYLFLEDTAKPSFLQNNRTVPNLVGNNFILPCVSSHFETEVELTSKDILPPIKSLTKGFIFESHEDIIVDNYYGNYICVLKYKGVAVDSIEFVFSNSTTISDEFLGLETLRNGDDIDFSGEPVLKGSFVKFIKPFCKTRSPSDQVNVEKLKLISVPSHNFGYMRLVQQFALPKYVDRSYTARTVNSTTGRWDSLKRQIKQPNGTLITGTSYCTTGYSHKIVDFGSTIEGFVILFDYGKDWATFDRSHAIDIKDHFGLEVLNKSLTLFPGTIISFGCRINIVVVVKPLVWYTERVNGTTVQEWIDDDFVGDTSIWSANISMDVHKVICKGSYWYSDWWKNISISVPLQEITTEGAITTPKTTTAKPVIDMQSDDFDVLVVVIPVLVFTVTAMAATVYIKCYRPVKTGLTQDEIDKFSKGMNIEQIPEKDKKYAHGFTSVASYKTEYEISPERFVVYEDKVLGSGAFGVVTMGLIDNKPVAVKTVQKHAEKQYLKALLSELKIMIYLGCHPNLVQIIGAYTKDLNKGIAYVFVEYIALGNLEGYLRSSKDLLKLPAINSSLPLTPDGYVTSYALCDQSYEYKPTFLTPHTLLLWSKQIVNGMEYLGSKNVIHGDLATRNVLLDENLNVKITDFGLSRQLYGYQNYIKKHQAPLPWRWMALESLKFLTFSTASDVWGFGITLWEIFSLGQLPYPGHTWTTDFVKQLESGMRMERPRYGSEQLFSIILQCWHANPKQRPVFKVLKQQLDEIIFPDEIPV